MDTITITLSSEEAERLSFGLSDLLCWCSGFHAARVGTDMSNDLPMGVEAARTINLKMKSALDRADSQKETP